MLLTLTPNGVPMTSRASQAKVSTPTGRLLLNVIGAVAGVFCLIIDSTDRHWQVVLLMQEGYTEGP